MPTISELTSYPIKSCAGTTCRDAVLTRAGLEHDRTFMVTDEDGVFRTQRYYPRLAAINPEVSADGGTLTLRAPGIEPLRIDVHTSGPRRDVLLHRVPYLGIDQGADVAEWLSDVLGMASRLIRVPPEHVRVTDGETPGTSAYADSGAVHVLSESSLAGLNARLAERGADPLPMNRFRPNVVVSGWDAHAEDTARALRLGEADLAYAKLAVRCAVTTVHQESGSKAGPEPLRTLATYRKFDGGVVFGAKFSVLREGKVSVGDEVRP